MEANSEKCTRGGYDGGDRTQAKKGQRAVKIESREKKEKKLSTYIWSSFFRQFVTSLRSCPAAHSSSTAQTLHHYYISIELSCERQGMVYFSIKEETLRPALTFLLFHDVAFAANKGIKWNVRVACLKISRRINEISGPWLSVGTCCKGCCCVCRVSAFRTRST
jgi:hypothetical protein